MNKLFTLLTVSLLIASCNLFEDKEKKAIETCQQAKIQLQTDNALSNLFANAYGLGVNATWLDYANNIAKEDLNKKYNWHARKVEGGTLYIVDFSDADGWGQQWEVDIEQKIVKNINQSEYLSRKYNFNRLDDNGEFKIVEITKSDLSLEKQYSFWGGSNKSEICYVVKAAVLNKTDKTITSATIGGKLKLIFKDKAVIGESTSSSGFTATVSETNPWRPNTKRDFIIKVTGIDKIYMDYIPEYIVFDAGLKAEDPVGYIFDKDIVELDVKEKWSAFTRHPIKSTDEPITNEITTTPENASASNVQYNSASEPSVADQEQNTSSDVEESDNGDQGGTKAETYGRVNTQEAQNDDNNTVSSKVNSGVRIVSGLNGRRFVRLPSFETDFDESAKVAIDIKVDGEGNVISAIINPRGTTTTNSALRSDAIHGAMQIKLNPLDEEEQTGTILFDFKSKG